MKILALSAAVLLAASSAARAQAPAAKSAKKKDKPAAAAPKDDDASSDATGSAPDRDGKKRVEAYLAMRTKKLQDAHAARMEFSAHETLLWEDFWGKVREARKTFELRTARQTVDLFSTLETLDQKDHAGTIADFEKLRSTMVKSFEAQQKQKMQDFFAAREARWKEFADAQERDRAAAASDADAAWQDDKNFLKSLNAAPGGAAPASSAPAAKSAP